jgi:hypothetical protein
MGLLRHNFAERALSLYDRCERIKKRSNGELAMHSADQDALRELVIRAYASGDGLRLILQGISIELAERIVAKPNEDRVFWLGLVERWQALEIQKAQQPPRDKSRSPLRRQSELAAVD